MEIEGLRGLAALGVLLFHVDDPAGGSRYPMIERLWLGVPMFFVLSGYLLYRPLAAATVNGAHRVDLRRYARARVLRIFPAYWVAVTVAIPFVAPRTLPVALAAVSVIAVVLVVRQPSRLRVAGLAAALSLSVLVMSSPVFRGDLVETLLHGSGEYSLVSILWTPHAIGPAWTLWFELCFYLTLPALAFVAHRIARNRSTPTRRAAAATAALSFLLPAGIIWLWWQPIFSAPAYFDQFAIGMLLAIALEAAEAAPIRRAERLLLPVAALAVAATGELVFYDLGAASPFAGGSSILYAPVMAAAFALIVATVLRGHHRRSLLTWRPLVGLGVISYGVYLWHMPILERWGGNIYLPRQHPFLVDLAVVLTLTIAAATASWLLVERQALGLKDRPLRVAWRRPRGNMAGRETIDRAAGAAVPAVAPIE